MTTLEKTLSQLPYTFAASSYDHHDGVVTVTVEFETNPGNAGSVQTQSVENGTEITFTTLQTGTYVLKLSATDNANNTSIQFITIIVTTNPVLTMLPHPDVLVSQISNSDPHTLQEILMTHETANYIDPGATAVDAEDGSLSHAVEVSGQVVNMSNVGGVYTIVYNVQDSDNNSAITKKREITITDISCVSGKYLILHNDILVCENCPMGSYSTTPGATHIVTCVNCDAGKWSNTLGADNSSACLSCVAGTWSDTIGATNISTCESCPAGTWSNTVAANNIITCINCVAGKYSTMPAADNILFCTNCPANTYSETVGANHLSLCVDCPQNYVSSEGSDDIIDCILANATTYGDPFITPIF